MESVLTGILERHFQNDGNIITLLQEVENAFGYLPEEAMRWLSAQLLIPLSRFYGIATFYNQFHLKKRGKNIITPCCGTACHVRGAKHIIDRLRVSLAIADGEETSEDGNFTIDEVACIGACGISPVVVINKQIYGHMTAEKADKVVEEIKKTQFGDATPGRADY